MLQASLRLLRGLLSRESRSGSEKAPLGRRKALRKCLNFLSIF